ncbi:hypothetical protein Tco_0089406 [Tanacetum coccineum]
MSEHVRFTLSKTFAARDEKWVSFTERVKISSTNVRLETTVPQKEEKFQVVINLIKKSSCFKAFTISADVPEIFMQQFWYSIKKVQGTDSYEFLLSNKKYVVNVNVFRIILDICSRVEGVNFTDVPDDDTTLAFLIKLGYKGPLIEILWGMFYEENVDYPELIWEDLAFQIDHRKEKRSRPENMPFPRFIKVIINHFLKQHKSLSNLKYQHYHTIKDDGIVSRLKFVRIGEDYQEYRLAILEVMLNDAIKQSESYQMFIKYSTGQIPPKKSRGKGKSISKTKAEEAEAARQVHATHARIVTESVPEPTRRRKSGKVTSDPPKKLKGVPSLTLEEQEAADIMQALKESKKTSKRQPRTRGSSEGTGTIPGVPNESIVIYATSSEGTGTKPGVPDEEKDITKEHVILE